ncbi:MAG: macro domain-containing protein, partial [Myxococcota bacterium]
AQITSTLINNQSPRFLGGDNHATATKMAKPESDDSMLTMSGGVSAAILRAGGPAIILDAVKNIPVKLGDVVVTTAGALDARHIFHAITIGEDFLDFSDLPPEVEKQREVVAGATRRCLHLLETLSLSSIAFPAIGTGLAQFSPEKVAEEMANCIAMHINECASRIDIHLYLFDRFGSMQPLDYIRFFEEFAKKTQLPTTSPNRNKPSTKKHTETPAIKARRTIAEEVRLLEHERDQIERRLASFGDDTNPALESELRVRLVALQDHRIRLLANLKQTCGRPVCVFLSYSHKDEALRQALGAHLSVLERQGIICSWHDRRITAGSDWKEQIDEHLEEADVILLLLSADFMNSKYCYERELTRAIERHEAGEALAIPVILRPVAFDQSPLARLQALPRNAKPVTTWMDLDSAFVDITEGLRIAIQGFAPSFIWRRPPRADLK